MSKHLLTKERSFTPIRSSRFQLTLVATGAAVTNAGDSCKNTCTITCKLECHSGSPVADEVYEEEGSFR